MHGFVMTNSEGLPETDIVTWRDSLRLKSGAIESSVILRQRLSSQFILEVGNELREGIPLAGIFTRLALGSNFEMLTPHSLISFVAHSLCGSFNDAVMHHSDAAAHGFLNLSTNSWHSSLLKECGISGLQLPRVTTIVEQIGKCKNFRLPVYVGIGDHQAALYGVALEKNELSLNIATGSQVSVISDGISLTCQTRPYLDGMFLTSITHIPAGRSLNVLLRLVGELSDKSDDDLWSKISLACERQEPTELQVDLSFFSNAQGSNGYIKNIHENKFNVGSLFNSAVLAMAENYNYFAQVVMNDKKVVDKIVLSGGLVSRFIPLKKAITAKFQGSIIREVPGDDSALTGLLRVAKRL